MDYRALLKKYMAHVIEEESISYVYFHGLDKWVGDAGFAELQAIEKEIDYERLNPQPEPNGVKIDDSCPCSMCRVAVLQSAR